MMVTAAKKLLPSPTTDIKLWEEDAVFSSLLMSYSRTPHPLVLIAFGATRRHHRDACNSPLPSLPFSSLIIIVVIHSIT
jgi:hypothetical protein